MAAAEPSQPTMPTTPVVQATQVTVHALSQANQVNEYLNVPVGQTCILGRVSDLKVDFKVRDQQISRKHADLTGLLDGGLQVVRRAESLNRVYLLGEDRQFHDQEFKPFRVRPGQTFAIGETFFTVQAQESIPDYQPSVSVSISAQELRGELLARPDRLLQAALTLPIALAQATSEEAMIRITLEALRANLPTVDLVAVVQLDGQQSRVVKHLGNRQVHVSPRLIGEALRTGEAVLYQWGGNQEFSTHSLVQQPTWGTCFRTGYLGYCLYLGGYTLGSLPPESEWRSVLRFLEFVGSQVGSMLSSRRHRLQQERLGGFLPHRLREVFGNLTDGDTRWQTLLSPQQCELTVMFCDLVGFGRLAQMHASNPRPFWQTVQFALNMMTQCIHTCDGVVIDFQGDSVLAVWGWPPEATPTPAHDQQRASKATEAVLQIREGMDSVRQHFEEVFQDQCVTANIQLDCGIALTSGPALVGFMGNENFGGLDVFGHTINRASRLQSLTRRFHTPILIDEPTRDLLVARQPTNCVVYEVVPVWLAGMSRGGERTFAVVPLPRGQQAPMPPACGIPTDQEMADFCAVPGNWGPLGTSLQQTPPTEGFRLFLAEFLRQLNYTAPADWDGVYAQRKEY